MGNTNERRRRATAETGGIGPQLPHMPPPTAGNTRSVATWTEGEDDLSVVIAAHKVLLGMQQQRQDRPVAEDLELEAPLPANESADDRGDQLPLLDWLTESVPLSPMPAAPSPGLAVPTAGTLDDLSPEGRAFFARVGIHRWQQLLLILDRCSRSCSAPDVQAQNAELLQLDRPAKGKPASGSSAFKGVTRHRWTSRWEGHIWDNSVERKNAKSGRLRGKQIYLGGFDEELDAARAYDRASIVFFGERRVDAPRALANLRSPYDLGPRAEPSCCCFLCCCWTGRRLTSLGRTTWERSTRCARSPRRRS